MEKIEYKGSQFHANEISKGGRRRLSIGRAVDIWYNIPEEEALMGESHQDNWPTKDQALADAHLIKNSYALLSALMEAVESEERKANGLLNIRNTHSLSCHLQEVPTEYYPGWYTNAKAAIAKATNTTQP